MDQASSEPPRWPDGSRVRWIGEPYVEHGPHGERLEVRAGDEGTVVFDDSPIEFCVTFPATGAFCPPRSSLALIEPAAVGRPRRVRTWRLRGPDRDGRRRSRAERPEPG